MVLLLGLELPLRWAWDEVPGTALYGLKITETLNTYLGSIQIIS